MWDRGTNIEKKGRFVEVEPPLRSALTEALQSRSCRLHGGAAAVAKVITNDVIMAFARELDQKSKLKL
ncbi:hypothetical protein PGTUg99_031848 [Puccinia graminis f. sp. tritici]|uniref:Uncharacterized protein n=1 Tax=Puccinia graminis f. sp. tritici TaxID=56615 RepID=A0A5B0RAV1_PUCGR|nr:hypothetical protein PGTUg99_031848 [Puccinia graminis f. sp. tritici]